MEGDQSVIAKEISDELLAACEELANLSVAVSAEQPMAVADRLLARLDEFSILLDTLREDTAAMEAVIPFLSAQEERLNQISLAVDALLDYIHKEGAALTELEKRATVVDEFFVSVRKKQLLRAVPLLGRRQNVALNAVMELPEWKPFEAPKASEVSDAALVLKTMGKEGKMSEKKNDSEDKKEQDKKDDKTEMSD